METITINIDTKYFEPVRKGEITFLIFDKKIFDIKYYKYIELKKGSYSVMATIEDVCIKSFEEITEEEARGAGFLNKDFLQDELVRRFNFNTLDILLENFDQYLFFCVKISPFKERFVLASTIENKTDDIFTKYYNDNVDFWRYDDEIF